MKISLIPESIPMQNARYIRENGSEASQVRRLMKELERTTALAKNPKSIVNNAEEFPNQVVNSSTNFVRKLLDII
ncbi:MAG: hypothetical protein A2X86_13190 [Bdellovibrionales bacterium GWA2_49_15]|nr:MAG: hypothetical protein A2X86_13190 [Bdellovibrionales bacterium GWA2_49_15]HAZ13478.1 hypothetical protein [Bdellovibrionales bacterium]